MKHFEKENIGNNLFYFLLLTFSYEVIFKFEANTITRPTVIQTIRACVRACKQRDARAAYTQKGTGVFFEKKPANKRLHSRQKVASD